MVNLAVFVGAIVLGFVLSRTSRRPRPIRRPAGPRPAPVPSPAPAARPDASPAPVDSAGGERRSPRPGPRRAPPPARSRVGLTPPELQRAALAELLRSVRRRGDRVELSSRAVLRVHPDDADLIARERSWFVPGIVRALEQAAAAHGWRVGAPIDIGIRADPDRRPGLPRLDRPDRPDRPGPSSKPGAPLTLTRSDTDVVHRPTGGTSSIGRSSERDIVIDNSRVSRLHARIERSSDGWMLVDLGSANGTILDGRTLTPNRPVPLHDGAGIGIGPVHLRVDLGTPAPAATPPRAPTASPAPDPAPGVPDRPHLTDAERAALARELLPPHPEVRP